MHSSPRSCLESPNRNPRECIHWHDNVLYTAPVEWYVKCQSKVPVIRASNVLSMHRHVLPETCSVVEIVVKVVKTTRKK